MSTIDHDLGVDYRNLVTEWRDSPHVDAAITWSPHGAPWLVENIPREHEHPRCRFLTTSGRLIVVRDGWIAGADRFSPDPVYGFGPDSGSTGVVTSWLCNHSGEITEYHRLALKLSAGSTDERLEQILDNALARVRW